MIATMVMLEAYVQYSTVLMMHHGWVMPVMHIDYKSVANNIAIV